LRRDGRRIVDRDPERGNGRDLGGDFLLPS